MLGFERRSSPTWPSKHISVGNVIGMWIYIYILELKARVKVPADPSRAANARALGMATSLGRQAIEQHKHVLIIIYSI